MRPIIHSVLVAVICALRPGTAVKAQVSVGYRLGVGAFHLKLPIDSATSVLGPSLALPVEIAVSGNFAIQPELGYTMKGFKEEALGVYHSETRFNYADLTLLGKYMYGEGRWRLEVFAGPNVGQLLSVRSILTVDGQAWPDVDQVTQADLTRAHRFDPSLIGGVGVAFACGVPRLFLNYRYAFGMSRVFEERQYSTPLPEAYHRGHVVSLGILIPIERDNWADHGAENN